MRIISESNLCLDRPYINLKKLAPTTAIRQGYADEKGLKSTYIIDQETNDLFKSDDYTIEVTKGIEKLTYPTKALNGTLLVDINYTTRGGDSSAKLKIFAILDGMKYALTFASFEDIYNNCLDIISKNIEDETTLNYIKAGFNNLTKEEISVDINTNLERLADFKDMVNYKRNISFFVLNNTLASISKFDIRNKSNKIEVSDNVTVIRYNFSVRLYKEVTPTDNMVSLAETDIICDLTDKDFPIVNMYTYHGFAKLLDIKNNIIPIDKNINLFANILDLNLPVLK